MSEKDWDAYVAGARASSRRIRAQVEAEYVQYMNDRLAAVTAERDALLKMADRMCGDHYAPGDCYSTGPLTGGVEDSLCPSCQYLTFRAALRGKAAS